MFYAGRVGQLSFYSAEARAPRVADLAGLLCGPGQAVSFGRGTAARVSVVVAEPWRAHALALCCAERGVHADVRRSEEGHPVVRTPFRADLAGLAGAWLRGAVKAVPDGFELDGSALRVWVVASGRAEATGYLLGLDPHAPDTHESLVAVLARSGLPAIVHGARSGAPALRVTGRRRLRRLAELVGGTPPGVDERAWPAA
jgi:hypothetical protein